MPGSAGDESPGSPPMAKVRSSRREAAVVGGSVLAAAMLGLAGLGGYLLRTPSTGLTVAHGRAYSSGRQAAVTVDHWVYALPLNVMWFSSDGTLHDGGRAPCLKLGRHSVTFAYVPVTRSGSGWRQVVWVSCN